MTNECLLTPYVDPSLKNYEQGKKILESHLVFVWSLLIHEYCLILLYILVTKCIYIELLCVSIVIGSPVGFFMAQ